MSDPTCPSKWAHSQVLRHSICCYAQCDLISAWRWTREPSLAPSDHGGSDRRGDDDLCRCTSGSSVMEKARALLRGEPPIDFFGSENMIATTSIFTWLWFERHLLIICARGFLDLARKNVPIRFEIPWTWAPRREPRFGISARHVPLNFKAIHYKNRSQKWLRV